MQVVMSLTILICTILSLAIGIVGIVLAADVLGQMTEDDSDAEAARIIV